MPSIPKSRFDDGIRQRHDAEGRQAEARRHEEERLADVTRFDERGSISARIRIPPQDAGEDWREEHHGRGVGEVLAARHVIGTRAFEAASPMRVRPWRAGA